MTKSMESILARLETWLRANRPDYLDSLWAPVSAEDLAEAAKAAEVADLGSLTQLYAWRGGQHSMGMESIDSESLWQNFVFMSAENIARGLPIFIQMREDEDYHPATWHHWVPFLNSEDAQLCVDYAGAFDGVPGQIVEFYTHDSAEPTVLAPSLAEWFDVFVTGIERGLWEYDDGFHPVEPRQRVYDLQQEMLPGFPRHIQL